jgi:hypothetical protein
VRVVTSKRTAAYIGLNRRVGEFREAGGATDQVRAGTQRPMGGAVGWARRGEQVDGSPLRAATLALWAWTNRPPERKLWVAWV